MKDTDRFKYGLSERDISTIQDILMKYPDVKTVYIFGSRAVGKNKYGSDIDLAIMNEGLNNYIVGQIKGDLEESSLPYRVDIVVYPDLDHKNLKDHIDRVGSLFYSSEEDPLNG
mgnify:CR=1 FL=1